MNPNSPAFPVPALVLNDIGRTKSEVLPGTGGMSIRLYIATQLASSIGHKLAWESLPDSERDEMLKRLIFAADALILADEKNH